MRVKPAVLRRFPARAALAAGLVCTLMLSGCAAWRNQTRPAPPVSTDTAAIAADAQKSAAAANAGAQTVQATKLQKFMWIFSPYRPDIQQGNFVSQEMLVQLKEGQTKEQVRFILGSPLLTDMFHADRWDFPFYLARGNGELTTSRVSIFFKEDKVARFEGGNLPTEREYIDRIAGPAKVSTKAKQETRPVEPVKVGGAPVIQ
ncbi:outer membrane protein assembly factor BamE [Massilia sp. ML15P13]|uniref:Outer membrane protein assembly factor BamE n=1 Tax=Telluria aromaticivorans TaxID=2725995 RepID=A0A7Y2P0N5_9BURK|nr:outer membrane protein assembly factor BamE [Telluria aromaticivorans]NNG25107.1 outer membrane protein assembly factor BamE [Telluria aromaticivorans]